MFVGGWISYLLLLQELALHFRKTTCTDDNFIVLLVIFGYFAVELLVIPIPDCNDFFWLVVIILVSMGFSSLGG